MYTAHYVEYIENEDNTQKEIKISKSFSSFHEALFHLSSRVNDKKFKSDSFKIEISIAMTTIVLKFDKISYY